MTMGPRRLAGRSQCGVGITTAGAPSRSRNSFGQRFGTRSWMVRHRRYVGGTVPRRL